MWNYEKRLQYPVNIKTPNAKIAQYILSQYGGPDGEIGASLRYLSQRFTMPNRMAAAVLNDIGTEELAHLEMVSTIVHQLTRDLSMEEIEKSGFGPYYIDHTVGVWPQAAGGVPFNACEFQSKGDPITDLFENLAAEQKARSTYDNILRVVRDIPEIARSNSCVQGRSFISSGLVKLSEVFKKNWMPKTSMLLIQVSTIHAQLPAKPPARSPEYSRTKNNGSPFSCGEPICVI